MKFITGARLLKGLALERYATPVHWDNLNVVTPLGLGTLNCSGNGGASRVKGLDTLGAGAWKPEPYVTATECLTGVARTAVHGYELKFWVALRDGRLERESCRSQQRRPLSG